MVKGLIACDVIKHDNQILANTIDQQYFMLDIAKQQNAECLNEVQKRDDIIERQNREFEMSERLNDELKKTNSLLRRKLKSRKIMTYAGILIGAGGGILIGKNLK